MRGQFYILSVVLLSAIVTTILMAIVSEPNAQDTLTSNDLLVHTMESAADYAVRAAVVAASNAGDASKINDTILNFTQESQDFARGLRASVDWKYAIQNNGESNATVTYNLTIQNGRTSFEDTFISRSALEAKAVAWKDTSGGISLNVTVYNEKGNETTLTNPNFQVFLNGTLANFNIMHSGAGGLYRGSYGMLGAGTYNLSVNVTDPRRIIARNSTNFTVT